jgi:hypothetical protein
VIGAATLAALALAAPAVEARAARAPASLSIAAWPARVVVGAPGRTTIHVDNPGADRVVVDAAPAGYVLDVRGRPRVRPVRASRAWLVVRPRHLTVAAGAAATLSVAVLRPRAARPGDHAFVVLLTTRLPSGRKVLAHLRIGVVVVARVPGPLVRRLSLGAIRVRRLGRAHVLEIAVANRGDVDEWLGRQRLSVRLLRHARPVATIQSVPRRVLARTRGLLQVRCPRSLHGPFMAIVTLRQPSGAVAQVTRTVRLRL